MAMVNLEKKIMELHEMCEKDAKLGVKVGVILTSIEALGTEAMELVQEPGGENIPRLIELEEQLTNLYNTITLLTGINLLEE